MVHGVRVLSVVAALIATAGGAYAQQLRNCGVASQASGWMGAVDVAAGSSTLQSPVLSRSNPISSAISTRPPAGGEGGPYALRLPDYAGVAVSAMARTNNAWFGDANNRAAGMLAGAGLNTYAAGYDCALGPRLVAGLRLAGVGSGAGNPFGNGRFDSYGYAAAPYLGYEISNNWSADVSAGLGRASQGITTFGQGARAGIDRSYAAVGLSGSYWFGRGQFSTRFALLHGIERQSSFSLGPAYVPEIRNRLTQAAATARYGYWFEGVVPYASLTLTSDLARSADPMFRGLGRDAWIPRIGVDFFTRGGISGGVSYSSEQGRNAAKNEVWSANMGFRF